MYYNIYSSVAVFIELLLKKLLKYLPILTSLLLIIGGQLVLVVKGKRLLSVGCWVAARPASSKIAMLYPARALGAL